jgi:hypothetical protein
MPNYTHSVQKVKNVDEDHHRCQTQVKLALERLLIVKEFLLCHLLCNSNSRVGLDALFADFLDFLHASFRSFACCHLVGSRGLLVLLKSGDRGIKLLDIYTRLSVNSDQRHGIPFTIHNQAVLIAHPSRRLADICDRHNHTSNAPFRTP